MSRAMNFSALLIALCCLQYAACANIENSSVIMQGQNITEVKVKVPEVEQSTPNIKEEQSTSNISAKKTQQETSVKFNYEEFFKKDFLNAPVNVTDGQTILLEENLPTETYEEIDANSTSSDSRLLGSTAITDGTLYPYVAFLSITIPGTGAPIRVCTGALLTSEYIITAASCVYDAISITVKMSDVFVGTEATSATVAVTRTGTALVHPKYRSYPQVYNLALVKLSSAYTLTTKISTINLSYKFNTDDSSDLEGRTMRILGYGSATANTPTTYALGFEDMKVLSHIKCLRDTKTRNVKPSFTQDCLDTTSGTLGGCNPADIGGLVIHKFETDSSYTLSGILVYYDTCGSSNANMFTRVGPFWDLIKKYIPAYSNIGR